MSPKDTYPQRYEVRTPKVTMRFTTLSEARTAMIKVWQDLIGQYEVLLVDNSLCHVVDRLPARRQGDA